MRYCFPCFVFVVLCFFAVSGVAAEYKLTPKVLETLKTVKVSAATIQGLEPFENQTFASQKEFLAALESVKPVPSAKELALITKHARENNLIIRAERNASNFKTGEVVLEGNVQITMVRDNVQLDAARVQVVSEPPLRSNKFIAETNVHVRQLDRDATADRAVYDRTTQFLQMDGNVVVKSAQFTLYGTTGTVDQLQEKTEMKGGGNPSKDDRAKLDFIIEEKLDQVSVDPQKPSTLKAQRIFLDNSKRQSTLEGNVEAYRPQRELFMVSGKVVLDFSEKQELTHVYAEQDVCIEQPGRLARADKAYFDEIKQTIRLEGNAQLEGEGKYLTSDIIELFLDVEKGEVRGKNSKRPLEMIINLDEESLQQVTPCR